MKIGEVVYARTHAELLNELLGTNYKAWRKSGIRLPDGRCLWMIELGNFVSTSGWINRLVGMNKISEKHIGRNFSFEGHNTYKGAIIDRQSWGPTERVVFDMDKSGSLRKYVFRGVFRLNKEESTIDENIWDLILDEYNL